MSAIIICISPEYALVATDTLVVRLPDFRPDGFTEKARLWAEAKIIVAGTGLAGFSDFWLDWLVNSGQGPMDIEALDMFAPAALLEMYRGSEQETTVYHVGIGADGLMKGYRYSSTESFASRPIPYGQAVKPSAGAEPNPSRPRDIKQIMLDQKELQDRRPPAERVHIGGRMYIIDLKADGASQSGFLDIF